jgi:hypothetical protein
MSSHVIASKHIITPEQLEGFSLNLVWVPLKAHPTCTSSFHTTGNTNMDTQTFEVGGRSYAIISLPMNL